MTSPKSIQDIFYHTYCMVHQQVSEIKPSDAGTFTIHMAPDPSSFSERVWSEGMKDWVKVDMGLVADLLKYAPEFIEIVYEGPYIMFHFYFENLYAKYMVYCVVPLDPYGTKDVLILRCVEAGAPEPRPGLSF